MSPKQCKSTQVTTIPVDSEPLVYVIGIGGGKRTTEMNARRCQEWKDGLTTPKKYRLSNHHIARHP